MADEKEGRSARREAGSSPASVGWMRSAHRARSPACSETSARSASRSAPAAASAAARAAAAEPALAGDMLN
eukprot:3348057-Pleurochrysis_carterae.AAC.2